MSHHQYEFLSADKDSFIYSGSYDEVVRGPTFCLHAYIYTYTLPVFEFVRLCMVCTEKHIDGIIIRAVSEYKQIKERPFV